MFIKARIPINIVREALRIRFVLKKFENGIECNFFKIIEISARV